MTVSSVVTLPAAVSGGDLHVFAVGTKTGADTPGLIGSWNFDEGSGTIAHDSSTQGNNGVVNGATWTSGKVGDSLSFNGSSNTVDMNKSILNTSNSYSVAAWVNLSGLSTTTPR